MEHDDGCCATDPSDAKSCTLPSGARDNPGTAPAFAKQDRAIEERYGKPGDPFAGMKNPNKRTYLPGQP